MLDYQNSYSGSNDRDGPQRHITFLQLPATVLDVADAASPQQQPLFIFIPFQSKGYRIAVRQRPTASRPELSLHHQGTRHDRDLNNRPRTSTVPTDQLTRHW